MSHIQSRQLEVLATKDDLSNTIRVTKDELYNAIKDLEIKLERRIDGLEGQITLLKWMMGFLLAGVLSLVLKAFF